MVLQSKSLQPMAIKPGLQAALSKLQPPQAALDNVFLSGCKSSAVQLMGILTSLTFCELVFPTEAIDLTPLAQLSNLQKLHLTEGILTTIAGLPVHLTNLTLLHVTLDAANETLGNSCVTSLRKLRVMFSELLHLHPEGLSACVAVEELYCKNCAITGSGPETSVALTDNMKICLPGSISALTSVTRLNLTIGDSAILQDEEVADLDSLYGLTSLQHLHVQSESVNISLTAGFSQLQQLRSLYLLSCCPSWDEEDKPPLRLELDLDWSAMHALQDLDISNWDFRCNSSMLGLSSLSNLSAVKFYNSRPVQDIDVEVADSSFTHFCILIGRLSMCRPQVHLCIDSEPIHVLQEEAEL